MHLVIKFGLINVKEPPNKNAAHYVTANEI